MTAVAEAPSRNGSGPRTDHDAYRKAVAARMKKPAGPPTGGFVAPSDFEVTQFILECQLYELEPLAGQIYAVWESGRMRAVTTIDGLRVLAERTGRYDGQADPEWCDKGGRWTDYWPGEEEPLAARVRVHKKGTEVPTTGTANWRDFAPRGHVGAESLWDMASANGKPAHMLSIRAEALALRKAFPAQLSGLYTAEELGISLADIADTHEGAGGAQPAAEEPPPPSTSPPPPAAADGGPGPSVLIDVACEQPSGPPARPQAKRTLAEALSSGDYARLHSELTKALFDQLPDRLTDEQSETLAKALEEAEQAGVTPVELERNCRIAMRDGNGDVEARRRAILDWIAQRRQKDDAKAQSSVASPVPEGGPADESPHLPPEQPATTSLLDQDPGPEAHQ